MAEKAMKGDKKGNTEEQQAEEFPHDICLPYAALPPLLTREDKLLTCKDDDGIVLSRRHEGPITFISKLCFAPMKQKSYNNR